MLKHETLDAKDLENPKRGEINKTIKWCLNSKTKEDIEVIVVKTVSKQLILVKTSDQTTHNLRMKKVKDPKGRVKIN